MVSCHLAATAAAFFLAGIGSAAPAESKVERSVEKVLAALEREGEEGLEQAARKLAELGEPAIPLLIQQLSGEGLSGRASASALQELGREAVVPHVSAAVAEDLSVEQRLALLHLLGLVGTERDLSLTVRAAGEADAIFASEIQFHYPLGNLSGAGAVKDYLAAVRMAFPDIHFSVADLVAEGDRVAARWTLAGSQTGAFRGRAPTGRRVSVPGITIFHVVDGKIHEMWIAFDPARLIKDEDRSPPAAEALI